MFVAFRALRRIEAGEALTVDLRVDPRTHRRYTSPHFPTRCFDRPPEPVHECPLVQISFTGLRGVSGVCLYERIYEYLGTSVRTRESCIDGLLGVSYLRIKVRARLRR